MKISLMGIALLLSICSFAQPPVDEKEAEKAEKQFTEQIEKEVDRLTETLNLEPWQSFYADSVLTHNWKAMQKELENMSMSRVGNADLYTFVVDKWMEKTYNAFHGFLNDQQWAKYLKSGASRDKKARDKRKEKQEKK